MRIMTFNIQHALDQSSQVIDTDRFARAIAAWGADVCGLNEVRGAGDLDGYTDQTNAIADVLGYDRCFAEAIRVCGRGPYGNALVSRYPIVEAETVLVPDPVRREGGSYETRCVLKAVLDTEEGRICVLVCHMGLEIEERESAVATLCRLIDATDLPIVLMGDFNAQPDAAVLAPLRERLRDTDELAETHGAPTFASYEPQMKIDYIFYRGLRCRGVRTVEEIVSDHFPIMAHLERL